MISKLHPTRSHSGAAEGGINAALGNAAEDSPEIHAYDTVKGSDYIGDQDAIEVFCREAPGDIYELEHWGAVFSRREDGRLAQRPFGAAGSPRTVFAADITGHVLIQVLYEQVVKRAIPCYEEYFAWKLVETRRPLPGRHLLGSRERRPEDARRQDGRARDGRRRPPVPRDDERLRLHRRRDGDGAPPRRAAEGHGVHAVPPDDDVPLGDPDHGGLPRRGRLPDQLGRRALHEALRAERDGARLARRRLPLRADGDRRGPGHPGIGLARPAPPRPRADPRPPAELARARHDLRRRRPDLRPDPRPARRPLPHGRRRDGQRRRDGADRPLRRRRVRLRLRPRRQPARRQLADGDDHVRPPLREGRRRVGARRIRRSRCPSRPGATPSAS